MPPPVQISPAQLDVTKIRSVTMASRNNTPHTCVVDAPLKEGSLGMDGVKLCAPLGGHCPFGLRLAETPGGGDGGATSQVTIGGVSPVCPIPPTPWGTLRRAEIRGRKAA